PEAFFKDFICSSAPSAEPTPAILKNPKKNSLKAVSQQRGSLQEPWITITFIPTKEGLIHAIFHLDMDIIKNMCKISL
ncbi:Hypothetical predicted protein, partial [Pelobates cultripes]